MSGGAGARGRVLVVDDDANIREVVRFALDREGFEVVEAADGRAALEAFEARSPDLVVLDILMPEMDGTEVCRRLRAGSRVPIVFLSSRDEELDRILGLELGGDDYVTKPFSPRELVARVKAVLRRAGPPPEPVGGARLREHGGLRLDPDTRRASMDGEEVALTATEFDLLLALMGYPGKVFTRDELLDRAWPEGVVVTDRTIDSHVRRIRKKFRAHGVDPVETVHGVGYRLGSCRP